MATLGEIEAVYRSAFPRFLRVATAIAGDEQAARDAVHEGFVRAVRYRRRVRGALEPWIWKIVVNEARRRWRPVTEIPSGFDYADVAASNGYAGADRVREAVATLAERQRLVLFLRYYADLDYERIAATLGIAPGTVAATLNAARAHLREQLKEEEPCPS